MIKRKNNKVIKSNIKKKTLYGYDNLTYGFIHRYKI
jgi:hypothetical protein